MYSVGAITHQWSYQTYSYVYAVPITPVATNIWFAGKLILESNASVFQDRLGTNRAGGARFMPYGDEITSTSNDREKFAAYTRDSYTGLDYADQRYYASTYGRFNTADPYQASGGPSDPSSWNRYSYTRGDPINRFDPRGLDDCDPEDPGYDSFACYDDTYGEASDPTGGGPIYSSPCAVLAEGFAPGAGVSCGYVSPGVIGLIAPAFTPPSGANSLLGADETDVRNDLAKPKCFGLLGFGTAAAAQDWFNTIRFNYACYGKLSIQNGAPQSTPVPANTFGYGTININTDYNWGNFSQLGTQQAETYNYLGFVNRALGTRMTSEQLGTLIIIHELEHDRPSDTGESAAEKLAIYIDYIK